MELTMAKKDGKRKKVSTTLEPDKKADARKEAKTVKPGQ